MVNFFYTPLKLPFNASLTPYVLPPHIHGKNSRNEEKIFTFYRLVRIFVEVKNIYHVFFTLLLLTIVL